MKRLPGVLFGMYGFIVACFISVAQAQEIAGIQKEAKDSIHKVYEQIIARHTPQSILSDLSERDIKVDESGWSYLEYSRTLQDGTMFYLLVRSLPVQSVDFHAKLDGYREFLSPMQDAKIVVYLSNRSVLGGLDIYDMVQSAAASIYPEERNNGTLQLVIDPSKQVYKRDEKVEFDLSLRNTGNVALRLRKLNESSTSCYFNGVLWGEGEGDSKKDSVLAPGAAYHKRFVFWPEKKGRLEIRCTYGLKFMGDMPTARATVEIQ
ncbi:MAG: hypothetical protein HGA80_04985 [Candidatus Omnitrophica bacterium]|nr:hypothetical protein [Candidatus Omnitrophota bacterium]